ncbi:hypothetical protein JNUCC42_22180 [Brevibacterium sp. JNUCC-42]|uniref:Uncharacterized protein n=1 Tax=Brevibacillus laterosporus TaxID=1465 RepID=A0A518VF60_BRELA|nr:hypothetical protein [Brevibacillus laterosporus]QDX95635.1 hypothetical protein EEL30_01475 [Brevibacillus laterosporus]QOT01447.1 hypothetical protein JNUCC42_22180 [Brevibacterium sp. JNUCC-42]TPG71568.1 hypothetical protein EEL31_14435 [Brevibacillus laterosporus]
MYTDERKEERKHVSWHEVLREIASLDGQERTLVHAAYGDHVDLVVSGGDAGYVLIQWKEYAREIRHYVLTTKQIDVEVTGRIITVEGEGLPVPADWAISLEQAIPLLGDLLQTCEQKENADLQWLLLETEPAQMS